MATTVVRPGVTLHDRERWENYPKNIVLDSVERQYDVWNRSPTGQADWRSGLLNLLYVIGQAEASGRRIRAAGATWSMARRRIRASDFPLRVAKTMASAVSWIRLTSAPASTGGASTTR